MLPRLITGYNRHSGAKKKENKWLDVLLGGGMKMELIIINQPVNLTLEITIEETQAVILIALFAISL